MRGFRRGLKVGLTLLGAVLVWEGACRLFHVPSFLVPPPSLVLVKLSAKTALFLSHSWVTLVETLGGFAVGVVVGVTAAAVIVLLPALQDVIMPILLVAQIVPKVAFVPILLIWFGYGLIPKILIAFLVAFFPVVVDTASGLVAAEPEMLDLGRSLEATRWQIFRMIQVPTALPHLFTGMKVSVTLALIGAVIGEFVGGSKGLGYLIIIADQELDTGLAFAALLILSMAGLILYGAVELLERICIPWNLPLDLGGSNGMGS